MTELDRQIEFNERCRRYRRGLLLRWAAWSLIPWVALVHVGAPYESAGEIARVAAGQAVFAFTAGVILLAVAALIKDIYRRLRYGIAF